MKRVIDLVVATIALFILAPFLAVLALVIKIDSEGPVFYRGVRAGYLVKPFRIFKFRTMVMNADKIGGPSSAADDPRITKVGRFLRAYKLDELPQLINVLCGEMSLVGPRPEVLQEVQLYTEDEKRLLEVRPGLTDWSSIKFRNEGEILRGSVDPHQTYQEKIRPEKIRLGLKYVDHHSMLTDFKIIVQTIRVVLDPSEVP
jgi:lipopolysaccharide/colanic/teichoic acid biosynthesis glycosyltransferase